MLTRRTFLRRGMNAAAIGMLARRGMAIFPDVPPCADTGGSPLLRSGPVAPVQPYPKSRIIDGLPFAEWFTGDAFRGVGMPFHLCENCFKNDTPPNPTEEVDVAVVGGGLSGLTTAYLLRQHNPVVLELRERFGGVAQGEIWRGTRYSLGTAYVITPDAGTFLETFYQELGLPDVVRFNDGNDLIELGGKILEDFWTGAGQSPQDILAFERYAEVVDHMANKEYPDIPLPEGKDNQWILDLDEKTFRQDIEERMGMPVPPLLAGAIQAYCYSSFCAGWEEISAAGGWNFLAAEEFGRWVFPGGISYMVQALWKKLTTPAPGSSGAPCRMRAGCKVVDVRLASNDRVQVTYADADGVLRSLLAKRVVMCCPKMLCKYILHDLETIDPQKFDAMNSVINRAYVVANVLLDTPIKLDFYDIFLLGDGQFPMNAAEAAENSRVVDMLSGHYARIRDLPRSVLTLYWPLPWDTARFTLILDDAFRNYAALLAPQIKEMLAVLNVPLGAVTQVRMTRWGHAVPISLPNMIAGGTIDSLRRPIDDRIYFVNQDNWSLPAVENCVLDAEIFVPQIESGL